MSTPRQIDAGHAAWWMRPWAVFAVFATILLALKAGTLTQPPAWDASFSVFPAAETLVASGYDYTYLAAQPGYLSTGPNVHSFSPVTLLTALAIDVLGEGTRMLVALHVIHVAIAALAATGVFLLARKVLEPVPAIASTAAAMLLPLVLTQAGFLYLEMPLLAATVWAVHFWLEDRRGLALTLVVLGVMIKQPGLATAAALSAACLLDQTRPRNRAAWAAAFAGVPLAVAGAELAVRGHAAPNLVPSVGSFLDSGADSLSFAALMPDVLVVVAAYAVLRLIRSHAPHVPNGIDPAEIERVGLVGMLVLAGFMAFHAAGASLGFVLLPRYWVQVVPFVVVGAAVELRRFTGRSAVTTAALALCAVSLVNVSGRLYDEPDCADFVCFERSAEYLPLIDNQIEAAAAVELLPSDVAVVVSRNTAYRLLYPANTYVSTPRDQVITVNNVPAAQRRELSAYPAEIYLVTDGLGAGAADLEALWEAARAAGAVQSERRIETGRFTTVIVHIQRVP